MLQFIDMEPNAKKVLVVEDDKFLSNILKIKLERAGFQVIQAFDGEEGLKLLRQEPPSLVVLDLVMPKISGFEFLENMSVDPQLGNIPVVVASNLGQESDISKARNLGVKDYYVKAQTSIDDLVTMFGQIIQASGG
jgi:DNA-binding response OmpR family regulator